MFVLLLWVFVLFVLVVVVLVVVIVDVDGGDICLSLALTSFLERFGLVL